VGTLSAVTQATHGTEKRGSEPSLCPHDTSTTITTPKCWHYCTCSGSCRGAELMGALFSTLPSIYKHNTVFPQLASFTLSHSNYSVHQLITNWHSQHIVVNEITGYSLSVLEFFNNISPTVHFIKHQILEW